MKHKLFSTANQHINGDHNIAHYVVEKSPEFFNWLSKLLSQVFDIMDAESQVKFLTLNDYDHVPPIEKIIAKDINKMIDIRETYSSKEGDQINLFYGKERVYITFRENREKRLELGNFLSKQTKKLTKKDLEKAEEKRENIGKSVEERPLKKYEIQNNGMSLS